MRKGKSLVELAAEIERRKAAKQDFIADTRQVNVGIVSDRPALLLQGHNHFGIGPVAHDQLAQRLGIPAKYYDRMVVEAPGLWQANVNHWLHSQGDRRMVRTLDGSVRAFLSDKYRPLENEDLAEAVLPVLQQLDVQIISCEITERSMYIKCVDSRITKDIPKGGKMGEGHHIFDTLSPAIVIKNSEIGCGALSILTSVWTRQCTNLATFAERSMRKYHVGARADVVDGVYEMLSDKTKRLSDAATWAQVRDVVSAAFEKAKFDALVEDITSTAEKKIEGDPIKAIEVLTNKLTLKKEEGTSVLRHLIEGGDLSQYGLFNAVTRAAEDIEDYDRATEMESMGGRVIELSKHDWKEIALAA